MNANQLWMYDEHLVAEQKWEIIRLERNILLSRCDWTQLPDAPLTVEEKQAWSDYRQQLRDIPETFLFPGDVVFPYEPGVA